MKATYKQRKDNECFEVPIGKKYRLACCDCGLVHDVVFLLNDNKLYMATKRNNRSTSGKRRGKVIPMERRKEG